MSTAEATDVELANAEKRGHVEPGFTAMILVAEDDAALRFILSEAIRDEGSDVVTAVNGVEALEATDRTRTESGSQSPT